MVDDTWAQSTLKGLGESQGFTSHPVLGTYMGSGYGVATYPERSVNVDLGQIPESQLSLILQGFAHSNADLLSKPGHYVGGWVSSHRELVLDISIVTNSRRRAIKLRDRYNQRCFYKFNEVAV